MSLIGKIKQVGRNVKNNLTRQAQELLSAAPPELPKENESEFDIAAYVTALWEESKDARAHSFMVSKDDRFGFGDPMQFYRACSKLESGNHYDVYGHRTDDSVESKWKAEYVDDEIQQQIRIKAGYVNGNWHDVTISPNIQYLNDILDSERHDTDWGKTIRLIGKTASIYGHSYRETFVDRTVDKAGVVREQIIYPWQVFKTPGSDSLKYADGCYYIIIADTVNNRQVESEYPELDTDDLASINRDRAREMILDADQPTKPYNMTRQYDRLRCFIDDNELENVPFKIQESQLEHMIAVEGGGLQAKRGDNHKEHIAAHEEWKERINAGEPDTDVDPGDVELKKSLTALVDHHIEDHRRLAKKDDQINSKGEPNGKRPKYPDGRLIIVIGNMLAKDEKNPNLIPWRELFDELKNEELPYRSDGRGDVEILWATNKILDYSISRAADIALTVGMSKLYWHKDDEKLAKMTSQDPSKFGFYEKQPPVAVQGHDPGINNQIYEFAKGNASRHLGSTKTVSGQAPTPNSSNKLAETLLRQSEQLITGELNSNLEDFVEKMIKTRIMLWRKFYTEPRPYFIRGKKRYINVSKVLATTTVENDDGTTKQVEIAKFEITVRPDSNFPYRWENILDFLKELVEVKDAPPELRQALWLKMMDMLAERFPELEPGGELLKMGEAWSKALQEMEQQKEQEEQKQKESEGDQKAAHNKARSRVMARLWPTPGKENGNGNATQQPAEQMMPEEQTAA